MPSTQGPLEKKSVFNIHLLLYFILSLISWRLTIIATGAASQWIGASRFGDFSVSLRLAHNLAHLFVMGQEATILMYLAKYKNQPEKQTGLVRWIISSTLLKTLVVFALIICCHQLYLHTFLPTVLVNPHIWIAWTAIPFIVICGIYERFFLYLKQFFVSSLARGIYQPLIFIALLYPISQIWPPSAAIALLAYTIAFALSSLIYCAHGYFGPFKLSPAYDQSDKKEWQLSGLFYTFSTLIIKSTPSIALFFLERHGSSEAVVGHFSALWSILYGFHLLTKPFDSYLKPLIANYYSTNKIAQLQHELNTINKARWLIILGVLCGLAYTGKATLIGYGDSFASAYEPLMLLSLLTAIQYLGYPAHEMLNYTGNQQALSFIMACQFFSIATIAVLLIPTYGIWGAVLAQGIPCIAASIASSIVLRKRTRINAYFFF